MLPFAVVGQSGVPPYSVPEPLSRGFRTEPLALLTLLVPYMLLYASLYLLLRPVSHSFVNDLPWWETYHPSSSSSSGFPYQSAKLCTWCYSQSHKGIMEGQRESIYDCCCHRSAHNRGRSQPGFWWSAPSTELPFPRARTPQR
jgi:hypothetical protein